MRKNLLHIMFHNEEGEKRHSIVLNDPITGEDRMFACAVPYTNGASDYADKLFDQIPGPLRLVFYNLDSSDFAVLARK